MVSVMISPSIQRSAEQVIPFCESLLPLSASKIPAIPIVSEHLWRVSVQYLEDCVHREDFPCGVAPTTE